MLILSVHTGKGSEHDFSLFKRSKLAINTSIIKRVDLGYKGIEKLHKNVVIPHKKSKNKPLTQAQKFENKKNAKKRIVVEHINRFCKIFRIVKEVFRGKHRNYNNNWNCIAALVNMKRLGI